MTTAPVLTVTLATLFVTDFDGAPPVYESLLASTLERLKIVAPRQCVVALSEQPLLGREYLVRVTPCLVLDTGARWVQIPGDLKLLNAARVEAAFARP